jgi:APA family basic amino acid/polyamine antiporter
LDNAGRQARLSFAGMEATQRPLDRGLGLLHVTAGGVGIIIGAGIYVLIGEAAGEAGNALWLSFVLAAALCAATGFSYAELASMFPSAGAEFDYTRQVFPEWVAFLVGWVMVTGLIVAAGTVSLGFGRYFGEFVEVDERIPAIALIAGLSLVGASGIRHSGRIIVALSAIQVSGLVAVIAFGIPSIGEADLLASHGAQGVVGGAALVFFAFIGFDEVITLAEETRDPTRTVPRALLSALGISAALYAATAVAAVSVLGAGALAASDRPLADVVDAAAGGNGATAIAIAALISTTNTTLLALTAASRLMFGMARSDALPRTFAHVTHRTKVPIHSLLTAAVLAGGCALSGKLGLIAQVTDFAVYLVFVAVNLTVVVLRWRAPNRERPIRSPLSIRRVPILPLAGLASVGLLLPALDADALAVGSAVCAVGLAAGLLFDAKSPLRRRGSGTRA